MPILYSICVYVIFATRREAFLLHINDEETKVAECLTNLYSHVVVYGKAKIKSDG